MTINFSVNTAPSPVYPPQVNERLLTVWGEVEERVKRADNSKSVSVQRLAYQALHSSTKERRIFWLRRAADTFSQAFEGLVACKAGCAHCCHIPVQIGEAEARVIGVALGLKPVPADLHTPLDAKEITGTQCPFLAGDQRCSIYSVRPSICRTHLSMDRDDLLCQLVNGAAVPVPYANATKLHMLTFKVAGSVFADLRQWFPVAPKTDLPSSTT